MAAIDLIVSEFIVLAVVCYFLIRYYKAALVTWDVALTVYLAWVLGFVGILLLPYDISVAIASNQNNLQLDRVWKFLYWSTFLLAWVVLPIQNEYHNSGHFGFGGKLRDALKKLFLAGVAAIVVAVLFIIINVATHSGTVSEVVGFMMACSNTYGVFLIIVLMGSGLVALPRRLWQLADYDAELQRLYISAGSIEATFQDARYELEDCEADVERASELLNRATADKSLATYVDVLKAKVQGFEFNARSSTRKYTRHTNSSTNDEALSTKPGLVALHARLIQAQIRAGACDRRWRVLMRTCKYMQELLTSSQGGTSSADSSTWCEMPVESSTNAGPPSFQHKFLHGINVCFAVCTTRYLKHICRIASVCCMVLSVLILWSEMVMSTKLHSPIGLMMGAYSTDKTTSMDSTMAQAISFVFLAYMSMCLYWSLFSMNLGWAFTLQGPQQSPPSSLIFNGEYFSRLQFPLGYNFMLILNAASASKTSFLLLMQNITVVPVFGTSFQVYIPIFMVIVALFTFFNVMSRLFAMVGIETEEGKGDVCWSRYTKDGQRILNEEDAEKHDTGKNLVLAELRLNSSNQHGSAKKSTAGSSKSMDDDAVELVGARNKKGSAVMAPVVLKARDARIYRDLESDDVDADDDYSSHSYSASRAGTSKLGGRNGGSRTGDDDVEEYNFMKYVEEGGSGKKSGDHDVFRPSTTANAGSSSWFGKLGFSTSVEGRSVKEKATSVSPLHGARPVEPALSSRSAAPATKFPSSVAASPPTVKSTGATVGKPPAQTSTQHKTFFDMLDDELENESGGRYA